jgi:two-component system, NarL family, response regulator NreC
MSTGKSLSTRLVPGRSSGPLTVFVAEKQRVLREALVVCLSRDPRMKVVGEAGDGMQAVDACLQIKPRLLLLSAELPGLNGVEICRTLSGAAVGVNILVMTVYCEDHLILRFVEAGALGIVETTGSLTSLVQAAEAVGQGQAFFGEHVTQVVRETLQGLNSRPRSRELSAREEEVLRLIAEGFSNKEIAVQLGICAKTVENHRSHLMRKLRSHNGADLTREAFRLGLVRAPSGERTMIAVE